MNGAIKIIKEELKYANKIAKEKGISDFWKGRLYTLKRIIRILNEVEKK